MAERHDTWFEKFWEFEAEVARFFTESVRLRQLEVRAAVETQEPVPAAAIPVASASDSKDPA